MAVQRNKTPRLRIRFANKGYYLRFKTIISYESVMRGRSTGQTLRELILEAADIESYPEDVRARIASLADEAKDNAAKKALENGGEND